MEGPGQLLPPFSGSFLPVSGPHLDCPRGGSLQELRVNADMVCTAMPSLVAGTTALAEAKDQQEAAPPPVLTSPPPQEP